MQREKYFFMNKTLFVDPASTRCAGFQRFFQKLCVSGTANGMIKVLDIEGRLKTYKKRSASELLNEQAGSSARRTSAESRIGVDAFLSTIERIEESQK